MSPDAKARLLQSRGLNPGEWDIDESTLIPVRTGQPKMEVQTDNRLEPNNPLAEQQAVESEGISKINSFLTGAGAGVIPTAAGLGAGALTGRMLTKAPAWVSFPTAIAAGFGASALADTLQRKVIGENLRRRLELAEQANPYTFTAGNIASGLPFFRFTPGTTARRFLQGAGAARALSNPAVTQPVINAAVGGGISAGSDLLTGQEVDVPRALMSALGGATMSEPRALARYLGVHGGTPERQIPDLNSGAPVKGAEIPEVLPGQKALPAPAQKALPGPRGRYTIDIEGNVKPVVAENIKVEEQRATDFAKAKEELQTQQLREAQLQAAELKQQNDVREQLLGSGLAEAMKNPFKGTPEVPTPEKQLALKKETSGNALAQEERNAAVGSDLAERQIEAKLAGEQKPRFAEDSSAPTQLNDIQLSFWQQVAKDRGANIEVASDLPTKGEVAPREYLKETLIKVHPEAGADVLPHELTHAFIDDMLNHGTASDKRLAERVLAKLEKTPEYEAWKQETKSSNPDANEFLSTLGGREAFRRLQLDEDNATFRGAWKDFVAGIKSKYGEPTPEQAARFAQNSILNTPGIAKVGKVPTASMTRASEDEAKLTTPIDTSKEFRTTDTVLPSALRSIVDNLASKGRPQQYIAERLDRLGRETSKLKGEFTNALVDAIQPLYKGLQHLSGKSESANRVREALRESREQRSDAPLARLTPTEKTAALKLRETFVKIADEQLANGPLVAERDEAGNVTYREREKDPFYFPDMVGKKQIATLLERPDSPEAKRLRDDYVKYQVAKGIDKAEAIKQLETMFERGGSRRTVNFNALRVQEGTGLPPSWREKDLARIVQRYGDRAADDLAYYRAIQSDPISRKLLRIPDDARGNKTDFEGTKELPDKTDISGVFLDSDKDVQAAHRFITNDYDTTSVGTEAANSLVKSLMMQTATGLRDVVSMPFIAWAEDLRAPELRLLPEAYAKWRQGVKGALKEGVARKGLVTAQEFGNNSIFSTGWRDGLRRAARQINIVTGREWLENFNRGVAFNLGKMIAEERLLKGDKSFQEKYGPRNGGNYSKEELVNHMAARFVESKQGTYDYRGQPRLTLEGPLQPLLSLSKWSVERLGQFEKNVISPARKGNLMPLLKTVFGTFLGGAAIQQLNTLLTRNKPEDLTWDEYMTLQKEHVPFWTAMLNANSQTGFAGDVAKMVSDISQGRQPRGFGIPVVDALGNTAKRIAQLGSAQGKEDLPALTLTLLDQLAEDYVQGYRIAKNQLDTDKEDRNARRDLRVFERVEEGKPQSWDITESNPFERPAEKEFKRTKDPAEAARLLPGLVESIVKEAAGNPEKIKEGFSRLRRIQFNTIPSPEYSPEGAQKFYEFLRETQGQEAADKRFLEYYKQTQLNQSKKAAVPTLE